MLKIYLNKIIFSIFVFALFVTPLCSFAVAPATDVLKGVSTVTNQSYGKKIESGAESERQLNLWIGWLIKVVLSWLGVILLGIIIYAGFMWLTAGGNQEQVTTARKWITNAVIGMIIITAAYFISDYVIEALSGTQAL